MKKDRYLTWTNYLVSGTVITVLGIIAIVGGVNLYRWTITILGLGFLGLVLADLMKNVSSKKKSNSRWSRILLNLTIAVVLLFFKKLPWPCYQSVLVYTCSSTLPSNLSVTGF